MTFRRAAFALALLAAVGAFAAQETQPAQESPPGEDASKTGAGPSPGEAGRSEAGVEFRAPELPPIELRRPEPLRIDGFEVHELADGTHTGKPGDLLLTVRGRGFLDTSRSPRLELAGGEMVIEDTLVNPAGTELFAVLPRETAARMAGLDLSTLVVRNPGGLEDTDYSRAVIETSAEALLAPAAGAPGARLVFRNGVYVRETADP